MLRQEVRDDTQQFLGGPHLQVFFSDYLCQQKRGSAQTVASYRDTFRLFLMFVKETTGIEPSTLRMTDVDALTVVSFLESLERQRGNAIRSRNLRLSAVRAFFRLVSLRDPTSVGITTRVLAIPAKREDKKIVGYLTREEMDALLAAPDRSRWVGRHLWGEHPPASAWERAEGPHRAAVAPYRSRPTGVVSGGRAAGDEHGVPHSPRDASLTGQRGVSRPPGCPRRAGQVSESPYQED